MKNCCRSILLLGLFISAVLSQKKDKYTDENRPYEFGFNIEGQQHRHEAKDTEGIITGEFGFITADGVYHVTVYATDENGAFKIISMKSIKVSPPLDGSPDPAGTKYDRPLPSQPALKLTTTTPKYVQNVRQPEPIGVRAPIGVFTTAKPLPVPSCSSCGIPSTTKRPPGSKPNEFIFQTAGFGKPPNTSNRDNNKQPPGVFQFPSTNKPTNNVFPPSQVPNRASQQNTGFPGISQQPISPITNKFQSPITNQIPKQPTPDTNKIKIPNQELTGPRAPNEQIPNPVQPRPFTSAVVNRNPTQTIYNPTTPNQKPLSNPTIGNIISSISTKPTSNPSVINRNPGQPTYNPITSNQNPLPKPVSNIRPSNPIKPVTNPFSPQIQPPNSIGFPKPPKSSNPPNVFFPGLLHPPSTPNSNKQHPHIDGKLPPGVTVDDMLQLLYRFNYTVGFHGHYETGYKNGAKIGGYFINGRDGISRIVEYVADENGYRPKITYINLGLDSPDTPKEDTEKNYGLRGQVFEWYSLR